MHQTFVITDLTFGDAGKGSITDALVRRGADLVVRYNGGAQAAHTVIDAQGRCHIFHQFGSGSLVAGVETLLSRYSLVNPIALLDEEQELANIGRKNAFESLSIDADALVTTPYHTILNRLRELARGANRHGSCGLGIGETVADSLDFNTKVLRFGDLQNTAILEGKLRWHRELKRQQVQALKPQLCLLEDADEEKANNLLDQLHSEDELEATLEVFSYLADQVHIVNDEFLADRFARPGCTIFEGAQGVLLDEDWGFHPHTTWSRTTPINALSLIEETGAEVQNTVLGLTRAYATRHGAGPFPTESERLTQQLPDPQNPTNDWQGAFRVGWLDLPLLRYAIQASKCIDGLIVTCLDRLETLPELKLGTAYRRDGLPWHPLAEHPGLLPYREEQGETLRRVEVEYQTAPTDAAVYAQTVAAHLNLPLLGVSYGPTANDKVFEFGRV